METRSHIVADKDIQNKNNRSKATVTVEHQVESVTGSRKNILRLKNNRLKNNLIAGIESKETLIVSNEEKIKNANQKHVKIKIDDDMKNNIPTIATTGNEEKNDKKVYNKRDLPLIIIDANTLRL